jgi:hypothetical protein
MTIETSSILATSDENSSGPPDATTILIAIMEARRRDSIQRILSMKELFLRCFKSLFHISEEDTIMVGGGGFNQYRNPTVRTVPTAKRRVAVGDARNKFMSRTYPAEILGGLNLRTDFP